MTTTAPSRRAPANTFRNERNEVCEIIHANRERSLEIIYKPERGTYYAEYAYYKRDQRSGKNEQHKTKVTILPWIGYKDNPTFVLTREDIITAVTQGWVELRKDKPDGTGAHAFKYAFNSLTFEKELIHDGNGGKPGTCIKWRPARIWENSVRVTRNGKEKEEAGIEYLIVTNSGVRFVIPNAMPLFNYVANGKSYPVRLNIGLDGMTAIANAAGSLLREAKCIGIVPPERRAGFNLDEIEFAIERESVAEAVKIKAEADAEAERLYLMCKSKPGDLASSVRYKEKNDYVNLAKTVRISYEAWAARPGDPDIKRFDSVVQWGGKDGGIHGYSKSANLPFEFVAPSSRFARFVHDGGFADKAASARQEIAKGEDMSGDDFDDFEEQVSQSPTPTPARATVRAGVEDDPDNPRF